MKEKKYFTGKGFVNQNLIKLLDMLVENDGAHGTAIDILKTELTYQRRLQGIYNALFGFTTGLVVVMLWRVL